MKGRIRTIKPEAAKDEDLWDLEQETGLPIFRAFVTLLCFADREGRFEWRPRALKAECLPYWEGDFSRVLDALTTRGLLVRYASNGREFGWVRNFKKHQVINPREEPSKLPPCELESEKQWNNQQVDACPTREAGVSDACPTRDISSSLPKCSSLTSSSLPKCSSDARAPDTLVDVPRPGHPRPSSTQVSAMRPRCLAEALEWPLAARANYARENAHAAAFLEPQRWPEVLQVATALHDIARLAPPRLADYNRDSGVKALVGLYADGHTPMELLALLPTLVQSDWWQQGRRGLSALTPEVIRRAAAPSPRSKTITKADEVLNRQLARVARLEAEERSEGDVKP